MKLEDLIGEKVLIFNGEEARKEFILKFYEDTSPLYQQTKPFKQFLDYINNLDLDNKEEISQFASISGNYIFFFNSIILKSKIELGILPKPEIYEENLNSGCYINVGGELILQEEYQNMSHNDIEIKNYWSSYSLKLNFNR